MRLFTRRVLPFLLCILMLFGFVCAQAATAEEETLQLTSKAAILMDAASGQVLYEQNADEALPVVTLGKLMSMQLIAEALENKELTLEESVTISDSAAKQGGSRAFLDRGASYSVADLLKATCMTSANDACLALAEKVAGSSEVFVQRMNQRAQELGFSRSNFASSTGWNETETTSSAAELAKLGVLLSQNKTITGYTGLYMENFQHPGGRETELVNPNRMVRFFQGCDGLQTGSAGASNYCAVVTASQGGTRLVAVILGEASAAARNEDAQKLLNYGFANFSSVRLARKDEIVRRDEPVQGGDKDTVSLVSLEDASVILGRGEEAGLTKEIILDQQPLVAPIPKGQTIGRLEVKKGDQVLAQVPLGVKEDVTASSLWAAMHKIFNEWIKSMR